MSPSKGVFSAYDCLDQQVRKTALVNRDSLVGFDLGVSGDISYGHGIASTRSEKYPEGTIKMQYPLFKELGLDLSDCYPGTLNLSIKPQKLKMHTPRYEFKNVNWYPPRGKTENFQFCDCALTTEGGVVLGYVYLPDPETKVWHPDDPHHVQIIAPFIERLEGGASQEVLFKSAQVVLLS